MSLPTLARQLERLAGTATLGARHLLGLDTNPVPADWTHVTKVDPEEAKLLPLAYPLYLSHTSAVAVGGSADVTDRNTEETFALLSPLSVPAFHEPSAPSHVTETTYREAEFLAVPEVLNGESEALVGTLGEALSYVREEKGPTLLEEAIGYRFDGPLGDRLFDFATAYLHQEAVFEAYLIMNPDSAAARRAGVTEADLLSPTAARERALAATYHLDSEVVYLEYSGTFGGDEAVDILEAVADGVSWPRIWYGGGLDSREKAERVLDAGADAVVVGDIFHDIADLEVELYERVQATHSPGEKAPPVTDLEAWVAEEVDVASTSAAAYLSTIPDISDPVGRARSYLAAAIHTRLSIAALADGSTTRADANAGDQVDASPPGATHLESVLGADSEAVARQLARGILAEEGHEAAVADEDRLPVHHLATTL